MGLKPMITLKELKRHIRRYHKKYNGTYYNFLGLVENSKLDDNIKSLFTFYTPSGFCGYDWVNGNSKMVAFISESIK